MSPKRPREAAAAKPVRGRGARAATRRGRSPTGCARTKLAEVVGQDHLLGPDGALTRMLETRSLGSLIFWGPPGTGKTTVARLLARRDRAAFRADLGDLLRRRRPEEGVRRGARAPRDRAGHAAVRRRDPPLQPRAAGLLPAGDGGRHRRAGRRHHRKPVVRAERRAAVARARAGVSSRSMRRRSRSCSRAPRRSRAGSCRSMPRRAPSLVRMADGDGRAALTLAEEVWRAARAGRDLRRRAAAGDRAAARADLRQAQDGHYNLISALHKSVRGSDPDAALYYLARMLDAGEDPLYPGAPRRAHGGRGHRPRRPAGAGRSPTPPRTPTISSARPEGELAIAQAVIYVATAPKSNAAYTAFGAAHARGEGGAARCCRPSTSSMRRPS